MAPGKIALAMSFLPRFPLVALSALFSISCVGAHAAEPGGGEWVRVPDKWLMHRFVRSSMAPAETYRIAIAVPPAPNPKSARPKVVRSSGMEEVDMLAADFVRDSVMRNGSLREMLKTKELYFQLTMTPPALDVKMRNEKGRRPVPPGEELYTPTGTSIYFSESDLGPSSRGDLAVIFPPGGGYPLAALVYGSSGNTGVDRYYAHTAALNWQTTRKSAQNQMLRTTFGVRTPQRWESVGR